MSVLDRIPELACPACHGSLREDVDLTCSECGLVYPIEAGIPRMVSGDLSRFAEEIAVQDAVADEYANIRYQDRHAVRYHDYWTQAMLAEVDTTGGILDDGCGMGTIFDKLSTDRIVGLDLSAEMLRHAAKLSDRLVLGNSEGLPFSAGTFDLVYSRSLIHHLPHPERAVAEMARVLRPGGELVLVDTNTSVLSALPRWLANRGKHFSDDHRNLSRRHLEALLEPHFRIDRVRYFGYLAYPLLGFPDVVTASRYLPFKGILAPILMACDAVLGSLPLVRSQSWAILVKATKLKEPRPKSEGETR